MTRRGTTRVCRAVGLTVHWIALAGFAVFSSACDDESETSVRGGGGGGRGGGGGEAKPAAPAAGGSAAPAAPAVKANPYEEGDYVETEFDVTRDPFRSRFDDVKTERGPVVETGPVLPLTPLQQHNLSDLVLVGVITGQGLSGVAMLSGRGGKSYLVRIGDKIGPPPGRVVQILTDRVIVKRTVTGPDPKDGSKRVDTELLSEIAFSKALAEDKD